MPNQNHNVRYDGNPSLMVFADTEAGRAEGRALLDRVLGWSVQTASIEQAVERLDDAVATGAVLVDVRGDCGEALDRLLDRLDLAAEVRQEFEQNGRWYVSSTRSIF